MPAALLFRILFLLCFFLPAPAGAAPLSLPLDTPERPGAAGLESALQDIARQSEDVIAIQRELVSRPAMSPQDGGEGEDAKARWIEEWLLQNDLPRALRVDSPDLRVPAGLRPNLIIRYPGASERTLWIVSHLDVSPPGPPDMWPGSPWVLRVVGDVIYGRGVGDKHNAIAAGLVLLRSLARNKITPPLSFGLILTSGEKTDIPPDYGIVAVLRTQAELFRPGDLLIVNAFGNNEGTRIDVTEKGLLWLKITVSGKQFHSSAPQNGVNALAAAAALITDLRGLEEGFPLRDALFNPPGATFVPTKAESNLTALNQIPGKFAFHLDCRFPPPYTPDEVQNAVRALADKAEQRDRVFISLERLHMRLTAPGTAPEAPVVESLQRAVRAQTGREALPVGAGGVSQAYALRARGIPVAVWSNAEDAWTAADEHISISSQLEAAQIFTRILFDRELEPWPAGSSAKAGTGQ
jgi:succinyl-diaminopimelate desuccinylase